MKRKILFTVVLVIITGFVFREPLFLKTVTYKSIGTRSGYKITNAELIQYIDKNGTTEKNPDIRNIIKTSLDLTSGLLHFTFSKNERDPNKLITARAANCIGYSLSFASICNYLLKKYGMAQEWTAKPQIGQLYCLGVNIHPYFDSPFFKDHDFVIIENKTTKESFAVDPTVNDYLRIDFVSGK
jgi:hypothetical protein